MNNPKFSINTYDSDGDIVTEGIFLHFGDTSIKIATDIEGYDAFIEHLQKVRGELVESYLNQ
ncbi:MAG: hypothetical protein KME47_09760 [Nodosilinea sp. WJT8-NPBG4]|jgi:hypothetical protein|nr:hypothetical protein [Nodosilinea sp. WJT8-NPBG4]